MFKIDIYEKPMLQNDRPIGIIHNVIDITSNYVILANGHWIKIDDIKFFYEIGFESEILTDDDIN